MKSPLYTAMRAKGIENRYVLITGDWTVLGRSDGSSNDALDEAQRLANKHNEQVNVYNNWNDEITFVLNPMKEAACQ